MASRSGRSLFGVCMLMLAVLSCALPSVAATPTPTPGGILPVSGKQVAPIGAGADGNAGNGGQANLIPGPGTPKPPPPPATRQPPVTEPANMQPGGPYVVKQTHSLGGETISGIVCSLTSPFSVNAATSKVAWVFGFIPQGAARGQVTYAYSIPSAGESHQATGTYTIGAPAPDGTLVLSLAVSDHVVFKGFDGNMPLQYSFDLVPTAGVTCP